MQKHYRIITSISFSWCCWNNTQPSTRLTRQQDLAACIHLYVCMYFLCVIPAVWEWVDVIWMWTLCELLWSNVSKLIQSGDNILAHYEICIGNWWRNLLLVFTVVVVVAAASALLMLLSLKWEHHIFDSKSGSNLCATFLFQCVEICGFESFIMYRRNVCTIDHTYMSNGIRQPFNELPSAEKECKKCI